jgi:hypothetical protein
LTLDQLKNYMKGDDIFQMRLEQIRKLPPEQQAQAIADLSKDYEGLRDILGSDVALGEDWMDTRMPEGRQAGNVYVAANPMEFLASALRQGAGAYQRKGAMDELRNLSDQYQRGITATMQAGMQPQGQPVQPNIAQQAAAMGRGRLSDEYSAPAVQPNVAQQAAAMGGGRLSDEYSAPPVAPAAQTPQAPAYDMAGDLASLRAAGLRSQAQQHQAQQATPLQARPELQMMATHSPVTMDDIDRLRAESIKNNVSRAVANKAFGGTFGRGY